MHKTETMENENIIISPDTLREHRIPPGQMETKDFPVLHEGRVPDIDPSNWTIGIAGLVEQERIITLDDFMALPKVKVHADIHCVTTWSKLDTIWEGVSAKEFVKLAKPDPKAKFVMIHAHKDFTTNLSMEDFLQDDVLFATKLDGKNITPEHGYPIRLIVPRLYFWKSAKWVTGVEFMEHDKRGFWEERGYHNHGDPWTQERYSRQE
jgi:DMSO/TMAO reductase YedYZ molybdopterin-dependent catalytic subunit